MSDKTVERLQVVIEATSKPLQDEMKKVRASIKESTKGIEEQKNAIRKSMDAQLAPIRKVREQMNRFKESIKNACKIETPANQFKNMEKDIASLEKQLQKLINQRNDMETDGKDIEMTQEYKEVQKAVADAEKQLNRFLERQEKMRATGTKESSQSWKKLEYDIEQARNSVRAAKIDLENMSSEDKFQNTNEWKKLNREISRTKTNLAQCYAKQEEFEKGIRTGRLSGSYRSLNRTLKDTHSTIKKTSGLFAALIQKFKTGIPWLNKTKSSMRGLGNEGRGLGGMFRTIGMTARFMFASFLLQGLLGQAAEGFKNLAKYSNQYGTQFNSSISMMYSSLKQLQNALATAFEPIINVVAPYISTLIQHLTAGANALAQFFSALTGSKTWTKATYNTQNYAESLDDAAGSAKKLKNELYGFDEITKQSDNESSGGGSGSGVATGDMFTEETVNNQFANFAQIVKDAWKNADFTEIGATISQKLEAVLNGIDWGAVYSGGSKFGTGLATFFNGLITPSLFGAVGSTVASALNTAIQTALSFGQTFDFKNLGESIGTGINEFFTTFNFTGLAETLNVWGKGLLTALKTALETADWEEVGKSIGTFISEIDFAEIAWDFVTLASELCGAVAKAIIGYTETDPIGAAIVALIVGAKLTGLSTGIGTAITTFLSTKGITLGKVAIGLGLGLATFELLDSTDTIHNMVAAPITAALAGLTINPTVAITVGIITFAFGAGVNLGKLLAKKVAENVNERYGEGTMNVDEIGNMTLSQLLTAEFELLKVNWKDSGGSIIETITSSFKQKFNAITFSIDALFDFKFVDWAKEGEDIVSDSNKKYYEKYGESAGQTVQKAMTGQLDIESPIKTALESAGAKISEWWGEKQVEIGAWFSEKKESVSEWWNNVTAWWGIRH